MLKETILTTLILTTGCTNIKMELNILKEVTLNEIPSGSGITTYKGNYFAIGDDSPFLFTLDQDFNIIKRIQLIEKAHADKKFSKPKKPDFETLELINDDEIVIFGSGSKSPQRDVFIRVLLTDPVSIERYNLTELYQNLKNMPLMQNSELNIEATAYHNNQLFLFNRNKNIIFQFDYDKLLHYLKGETMMFPMPTAYSFNLPKINHIEAGFSGATVLKSASKIIFTASVEHTDNAYDDGEILGSFIGIIDLSNNVISSSFDFCMVPQHNNKLKIESVAIDNENSIGNTSLLLIADDDKGSSTILKGTLNW